MAEKKNNSVCEEKTGMRKILSIVVPVYKVEDYINKCLDSLLVPEEQLRMLDVVVVNDGTPDDSALRAKEYEKKYPEVFRVIDQENRGHGGAWNHGTELAVGKYLFYLDSDDWFDTSELSKLITYLKDCDVDLVLMDRKKYFAKQDRFDDVSLQNMEPDHVYDANTFDWLGSGNGANITYPHNTVYRTCLLQQYQPLFCEHVMYDDVSMQVIPIAIANSFVYKKLNVYRYYIGRSGQSFDPKVRMQYGGEHLTKVLMYLLVWMKQHRDVAPKGTTRRVWFDYMLSDFGICHYGELSKTSWEKAKSLLESWDVFIRTEFPDMMIKDEAKDYRELPFPFFMLKYRLKRQKKRIRNFIHRCIK